MKVVFALAFLADRRCQLLNGLLKLPKLSSNAGANVEPNACRQDKEGEDNGEDRQAPFHSSAGHLLNQGLKENGDDPGNAKGEQY